MTFTCAGFVQAGTKPGTVPLFDTCRAMVQTGNDVNDTGGATRDSLGLSADELAVSLQHIATEETANTKSMSTELTDNRLNTFLTRLVEVRRGVRGFSVSGFGPKNHDMIGLNLAGFQGAPGTGGAAGDGEDDWAKLSVFVNGSLGAGDRDATSRTDAFDFDTSGLTIGADYLFGETLVVGGAIGYADVGTDFIRTATVAGGNVDADSWAGFVYGTYYGDDFYIDGLAGFAKSDYDIRRKILIPSRNPDIPTINETAKASTDSDDYTLSIGAGYDFYRDALTYGPFARLTYLNVDVDDYTETGAEASGLNLEVRGQSWKSFTSVLGVQGSYAISRNFGILVPQARLGWVHEFENNSEEITAQYVDDPRNNILRALTDNPDRDYVELAIGISAVFKGGAQAYFNYDTLLGFSNVTQHLFSLGGRWDF